MVVRTASEQLLLGEWACLGILYEAPAHGFAIASRLKPESDIGRVWSLSRPLTYRSLEQLALRGYIEPIGEERGIAGGNRTILAATRHGRARLRTWVRTPVAHLRDLRSELLLKLVIAERCGIDVAAMLAAQRERIVSIADALNHHVADAGARHDVVALWRNEAADAALRFVDAVQKQVRARSN
jgi:DNA-binding PadR family transcriptional regulator